MNARSKLFSFQATDSTPQQGDQNLSDQSELYLSASNLWQSLLSTPTQIWKSRISWRITLAAFLTILVVQLALLSFTLKNKEFELLNNLEEIGRSAIASIINPNVQGFLANPVSKEAAERLLSGTIVNGVAIYSNQFDLIETYGEPVSFIINDINGLSRTYQSPDGSSYDTVYRANDLKQPYVVVARMDSSSVENDVMLYVRETILIMLLLSAFVTSVLMIALGRWLLEPILFLRNNLMNASRNPENPQVEDSPYDSSDEIGGAIELSNNLIRQNAANMKRVKSAAEDKIHKLAYYDSLTQLPNRTLFLQSLTEKMRPQDGHDMTRFMVATLDLDHFKDINDSMGHNVGDAILRGVGKRLKSVLPESALVSRSGEDEFAVTVDLSGDDTPNAVAQKIMTAISGEPFSVFNEQFQVHASMGLSVFPDDGTDPDEILKHSDIALNRAKEEGRGRVKEYSEDFDRAVQERFQMLRDLRDAMDNKELQLFYQPQFDLRTGQVIGAEALLRWWKSDNSKAGGHFISPGDFIPVAEQSGLIIPIGEWVITHACETLKQWQNELEYGGRIAVNVSPIQFSQSGLVEHVEKTLVNTGINPHQLEIEVTESVFMADIDHTISILKHLHEMGVEMAIDDFGTGYSSLSYLRQFPIDRLKIDQSFIMSALKNPDDASITRTIIALGSALNLKVIAEGVETKEHEAFLMGEGCDEVQGFRYSKPIPHDEFMSFLKNYSGQLDQFDS